MELNPTAHPLLVFADDGAEASDRAWRWIAAHPWPEWGVEVITADADLAHFDWGTPVRPEPWTPPWERDGAAVEAARVRFLTAAADPRAMLADVAADVLVLGMQAEGRLEAALTGSTTEWLLHQPPCPLAIIRRPQIVARVLVCADGSPHSHRAIEAFTSLPLAEGTTVTVLSVDDGRVDAEAVSRGAAAALEPHVASVSVTTTDGRPTEVILDAVSETQSDLVVLGTRGLTGWQRLRLGSTASAVARSTPGDVLVASAETSDEPA